MEGMKAREEAFEQKFVLDKELWFKANAQRNHMIGLWAADRLGKNGQAADDYAKNLVNISLLHGNEDDVVAKIIHDFKATNIAIDEKELRLKMAQLLKKSVERIKNS